MITRSGYKYKTYDAVADDGYITIVTHLINPRADHRFLRQPPVLVEHGGTIDPTAYLIGSSIQHHPEPWPRRLQDGPITSWNRSLAFVLANNGFDVWLAETRGSNDENKRRIKSKTAQSIVFGRNQGKNLTVGEQLKELERKDYWDFSQDDIIAHELKSHIDLVLRETGSKRLNLMTFSLSTPTSLAFFSIRPDYVPKIQGYVSMSPIVSGQGVNKLIKFIMEGVCPVLPAKMGTMLVSDLLFTQPIREIILALSKSPAFRYTGVKGFVTLIMGPSAKYQTLLDLNVMGHMLRQLSFKEAQQLCQQMKANKLQKYDYGPLKNRLVYGQRDPPVYDLSNLGLEDWIIVAGANDKLAPIEVMDHLVKIVNPKPSARLIAPGLNHLDMIAGLENDIYVNLPIMKYFASRSTIPTVRLQGPRSFDLPFLKKDEKEYGEEGGFEKVIKDFSASLKNPGDIVSRMQKEMGGLVENVGKLFKFPPLNIDELGKHGKKDKEEEKYKEKEGHKEQKIGLGKD